MQPSGKPCGRNRRINAMTSRGGASACPARVPRGDGDGAGGQRADTPVGDSDPADLGGEVLEGRVAVWIGLTVDVPGGVPDLWVDVRQQASFGQLLFAQGAVDGCEGVHRDKEVGSGRAPRVTVL